MPLLVRDAETQRIMENFLPIRRLGKKLGFGDEAIREPGKNQDIVKLKVE